MNVADLPLWATLLLLLGLVARVTRLVVEDSITQPIRNKMHLYGIKDRQYDVNKQSYVGGTKKQQVVKWLSELVHCPWCSSIWIGTGAVLSAHWWADTTAWALVALIASVSYLASWILGHEE